VIEVAAAPVHSSQPLLGGERRLAAHIMVYLFVVVPPLALLAAIPFAWGWGLSWHDIVLSVVFYVLTCLGVTVGFHRCFAHGAFKSGRLVRIGLAVAGSMAVQGPILHWVADHRRHHAFADRDGDPHSPWLFGTSPGALVRGFWHAHLGWVLNRELTNQQRFIPDLLAQRDMRVVHKLFGSLTLASLALPAILGGLLTWSWWGGLTALFWAGLVRVAVLHHVAWSVNSICHMVGQRPYASRDRSANFWPLAILSMGESWHNLHHADPTCARHGVRRGEIDISAWVIRILERLRLAYDVRWPDPARLIRLARAKGASR